MPVTKTAKRALRSSLRKKSVNAKILSRLEISLRKAAKSGKKVDVSKAVSMTDIAAKKKIIHKNKAARIKARLNKNIPQKETKPAKSKKTSKKK